MFRIHKAMKVKKLFRQLFAALPVIAAMIFFLAFPLRYTESVREGVSLWAISVLPATFPFLFLTAVFTELKLYPRLAKAVSPAAGALFRVSGEGGCAAFLSMLSGYPVGARTVFDLYRGGRIAKEETFRLTALCTTTGPMFMVGAVGARMFGSAKAGWILLLSHLAAVWTVCFFLRFTGRKPARSAPALSAGGQGNVLYDSLLNSVLSILCVGGSIALFYAFGQMLADLGAFAGITDPTLCAVVRGLLEMTSGCKLLSETGTPLNLALACFLVTFGGCCVLMQQLAFLSRANVKALPFLAVKLLQGVLSAAICFTLTLLFGV